MQIDDYAKWINLNHDLALVEDDLREFASTDLDYEGRVTAAERILYERFGVDVG